MKSKRILIDTGVWISYFGRPDKSNKNRVKLAREIIHYCCEMKIELFYCPYVEAELNRGPYDNTENIKLMKKIASKLPAHIGNDSWEKIDMVNWEDIGSRWNNDDEVERANELENQLPDKKTKSNRVDRNLILTAEKQKIDLILHENPRDYDRLSSSKVKFINLLSLTCLDDFKVEV